jgi:hypothetical protein
MLTRLIQRTETVAEESVEYEYEYEYRDAEYEKKHEQRVADEGLDRAFLTCVESPPRPR